jgi:hypothetical protein
MRSRVIRLFSALKDLQKILNACSSAVIPVCNAFMILLIIASVYAIVGTTFFYDTSPEYFANFHTSLFTMFQVRVVLGLGCRFRFQVRSTRARARAAPALVVWASEGE